MLKYFFAINLSILVCFLLFKMYQSKKEPFTTPSCDTKCPTGENKHTLNIGSETYIKCCPPNQYASVDSGSLSCDNCPSVNDAKYNGKYENTPDNTGTLTSPVQDNSSTTRGHCQAVCKNGDIEHGYAISTNEYKGSSECGSFTTYTPMTSDDTITVSGPSDMTYHFDYNDNGTSSMKKRTTDYTISGDGPSCNDQQKVGDSDYCCVSGKEPRKNQNNIRCCNTSEYLDDTYKCTPCPLSGQGSYNNDGISACYITGDECIGKGYTVNGDDGSVLTSPTDTNTRIYHSPNAPPGSYNCKMYECSFSIPSSSSQSNDAIPLTCDTEKMYSTSDPISQDDRISHTDGYNMFYVNDDNTNTHPTPTDFKYKNTDTVDGNYDKYYLCPEDKYLREDEAVSPDSPKYGCCPINNSLSNDRCIDLSNDPTKAIENTALKEGARTGDCLPYYYQDTPDTECTECENNKYTSEQLDIGKYGTESMWQKLDNVELDTTKISSMLSSYSGVTLKECKKKCSDNDHTSNGTNDCRLIEFTPSISSTPATCKLYDLPQPTPPSSPPSDTDNGKWFQLAPSSSKELYLLNCASGTNNLTHYQYVTSTTTPNCIGKMLMKKGMNGILVDNPRYCHLKSCTISTYRGTKWNDCFPKSEDESTIYCTNKYNETDNYCLTFEDLKDDCEDPKKVQERYNAKSELLPVFKNQIYRYYNNQTDSVCRENDDNCTCKSIGCSGQYIDLTKNTCEPCTSPEYVNYERTGCASFFTDQTKYFYIKQNNNFISGKTIKDNIADATIFKITDSEEDAPTVRLESGNDILCIVENSHSSDYGFVYEVSFNGIPSNAKDLKLEIINENENDLEVKIYFDDKFLKSNLINADLTTTTDYEESTCKFTLEFITCPAGYELSVSDKNCKETADTYNERLRNILKASYDDCHVEFKGANNATYAIVNKYNRSEWMEGNREYGGDDPWDNLETGNHWSGPAPYLRNSDLTKEYYNAKVFGRNLRFYLDNWGTSSSSRIMLVGRNCCFREYEHPIGTPGGNPNTETCNNGTPQQEAKKQATLSAVDIWLRSPEDHVPDDQKLRQTSNPT